MRRRNRRTCAGIALVTGAAWHDSGVSAAWVHSAREKSFSLAETARQRRSCTSFGRHLRSSGRTRLAAETTDDLPMTSPVLLASATGLLTGAVVVVLNDFVHSLQDFLLELPGQLPILAPILSASLVSLLLFLRGPKGLSGDSDLATLKANGGVPSGDLTEAPLRALAAGLTLAGGNSLGPESPSVEIGANIAANLGANVAFPSRTSNKSDESSDETELEKAFRKNLLAAGCASGIAAGFNAPIAGLFFALESVPANAPDEARARGFSMQLIAAVLAATVSQLGLGSSPAVDLEFFGWVPARSLWELPVFMFLGLLCGLVAATLRYLRRVNREGFTFLAEAGCPRFIFPVLAGIVVAVVTLNPSTQEVLYKGFANVNLVLEYADGSKQPPAFTGDPLYHLSLLLLCKIFLTATCQSSGQVGGLFAPALFMGACLGGLFGRNLRDNFWPWAISLPGLDIERAFSVPATYAVVGMAACLGSICNLPLTAVVLLLELAGGKDYGVVLPTVAATGVAVYVEDLLVRRWPKLLSRWEASSGKKPAVQEALEVQKTLRGRSSVVTAIPPGSVELAPSAAMVVPSCLMLEEAREQLLQLGSGGCLAVVEESNSQTGRLAKRLLGVVSLADVDKALQAE
ncbi:unnamed protein product [Durusdinium trenchii]|uniref:Chloride channel protein n=1 Tax=Durusdinium trenchii TaxID=1381693 RepID=A0ABP0QBQ5_9DINO